MLKSLTIKNFAIIEEVSLTFEKGMTTLTGETGAGKSIIIDAVSLLIGGRGSSEFVRHGSKKCVIEGTFTLPPTEEIEKVLENEAIDFVDQVLDIQREIFATGRSVCRINGSMITIGKLKEIGTYIIDIHGQNEHQELMNASQHINLVDAFGGQALKKSRNTYKEIFRKYSQVKKELLNWEKNEQESMQQLDMFEFQIKEIVDANLHPDEEEELVEEERKLANFQKLKSALSQSYYAIQNDTPSGLEQLGIAMESMESIAEFDEKYQDVSTQLQDAFYTVQDLASEILSYESELEYDEQRLNDIMKRLEIIQNLKRKYGNSIEEILQYQEEITTRYEQLKSRDTQQTQLKKDLEELEREILVEGRKLSELRRETAKKLEREIKNQLDDLYMKNAQFNVRFAKDSKDYAIEDAQKNGLDTIEFYVSTNAGEPLKPLVRVASGGELSRLMLAIKSVFSSKQGVTSIIFDEIDTGVSGRVAQAIANKMHIVSEGAQVLAVSHLPQVAAASDHHLFVQKRMTDNNERTITEVKELTEEERVYEIARMLSGEEITTAALDAARDLMKIKTS